MVDEPDMPAYDKDGKRVLRFPFERIFCPFHGEVFREDWPAGFPIFMVKAWDKVKDKLSPPQGVEGNNLIAWFELELDKQPLCCRLTKDEILAVYLDAKKEGEGSKTRWKKRICKVCGNLREGSKVRNKDEDGQVHMLGHVCLWCLVYKASKNPPGVE